MQISFFKKDKSIVFNEGPLQTMTTRCPECRSFNKFNNYTPVNFNSGSNSGQSYHPASQIF
jgi:hypothetical protein